MNELELWRATGRRALRVARQRGLTLEAARGKALLLGGGLLLGAALTAPLHHAGMTRHEPRFAGRVMFGHRLAPGVVPAAPLPPLPPGAPPAVFAGRARALADAQRVPEEAPAAPLPAREQAVRDAEEQR